MKSYITGINNIGGKGELLKYVKEAESSYEHFGDDGMDEKKIEEMKTKGAGKDRLTTQNDRGETGIVALIKLSDRLIKDIKNDVNVENAQKTLAWVNFMKDRYGPEFVGYGKELIAKETGFNKPLGTFEKAKEKLTKSQADKNEMLFDAVIKGDTVGIQNALAVGANIEARDGKGNTPLMVAAHVDQAHSVYTLTAAGANINARNYQNLTALHFANEMPIHESPEFQAHVERHLIKAGADVNATDIHGRTPIMCATNLAAVEELTRAGSKVTQEVKDYWKNEGKEDLVNEYESYEQENQAYSGGYKSEERLREEAAYLSQDQGEDEHEQQGQSA